MINFFRKIRKKLADDNKPLKYLRYAVGEIVLVVIGILIALQINNWNEAKKERTFEKKMLTEIRNVLVKDIDFFNNHLITGRLGRVKQATRYFENYLRTDSIHRDSINYHFSGLNRGLQITYNRGPFEALKSTGIDKISNDSLRNKIIDIYEFMLPRTTGLITIFINEYNTEGKKYENKLRDNIQIELKEDNVLYNYNRMKNVDLKTNQDFLSLLSWSSNTSKDVTDLINSLIPPMKELVREIDLELNKN